MRPGGGSGSGFRSSPRDLRRGAEQEQPGQSAGGRRRQAARRRETPPRRIDRLAGTRRPAPPARATKGKPGFRAGMRPCNSGSPGTRPASQWSPGRRGGRPVAVHPHRSHWLHVSLGPRRRRKAAGRTPPTAPPADRDSGTRTAAVAIQHQQPSEQREDQPAAQKRLLFTR